VPLLKVYGKYTNGLHESLLQAVATLSFREHVAIVPIESSVYDWEGKHQAAFIQIETSDRSKLEALVVALLPLGLDLESSPLGDYFLSADYKAAYELLLQLQEKRTRFGGEFRLGLLKHEVYGYPAGKVMVYIESANDPTHVHLVTPSALFDDKSCSLVSENRIYRPDCLLELPERASPKSC
jgi:hypothetical protein